MDLGKIQRSYLYRTGGMMLAYSVVMMATAILVGFLASRIGIRFPLRLPPPARPRQYLPRACRRIPSWRTGSESVCVLAIIALLVVQAYCDLALPQYTADIVDIGIGQKGIT